MRRNGKLWQKIATALSCVVVFCCTYALILPAITMEKATFCGIEAHQHTASCHVAQSGEASHGPDCTIPEHSHSDRCYSDPTADTDPTDWLKKLPVLTGVWAEDVKAAAESQLGYAESSKNYHVQEDGSHKGYTFYGSASSRPYDDWSAAFAA